MSRRSGWGRGFTGRREEIVLASTASACAVLVDRYPPVEIDDREGLPQPLVFGLALLIGSCRRLVSVDEIDNPASRKRDCVIDAIKRFPEEACEAADQLQHQFSRRSNRTETARRSRQWVA
jgi:hypothetical protein